MFNVATDIIFSVDGKKYLITAVWHKEGKPSQVEFKATDGKNHIMPYATFMERTKDGKVLYEGKK